MANDPQPSGFITVRAAFERLAEAWGDGKTDAHMGRMQAAFAEGELKAIVEFPDKPNEYVIPAGIWNAEGFPDRVFLSDDVVERPSPGWEPYRGRTTFVRETSFQKWLQRNRPLPAPDPDPADFDVLEMPVWTLVMTLGWIETRSVETVRWQVTEWLSACGLPATSMAVASLGKDEDDDDDPHPMFFSSLDAMKKLRKECEAGAIIATAVSSETGRAGPMAQTVWTYGHMTFGADLNEIWWEGGVKFSRITFNSKDVLALWRVHGPGDQAPLPTGSVEPESTATPTPRLGRRKEKAALYEAVVAETFPQGVPITMTEKERNRLLNSALDRRGEKARAERSWRTHFNGG